ncbi:RNA polymerase sigma-70 factor, ECF subfamily [Pedobacter soli]|uniref:RNA polymerase sigma-70 factor, ECF subfamily n=1 Tax=Pedobacter soli TaxID=390242 RepID=A0A1G7B4X8_9SPHI|nr:RNA polymerase sigma-70 factor, ECF subfamily [Pedobacter soli]
MKETESTFLDLINRHKAIIHKISKMYTDDAEEQRDLFQEIVLQL